MHQLFTSVHGLSDERAISGNYQGHHITPEHPPVTHIVLQEDAVTHTHAHSNKQMGLCTDLITCMKKKTAGEFKAPEHY